ncbi:MAG: ribbon-helix-helix protein, CopG family [Clostridium sp.]|nr:ribbon-helix-helix protein, CopG family [Clostridium sp.]MCM1460612.1 ribbon-helix-helix protein, CopG family [Bacteroides sp.]
MKKTTSISIRVSENELETFKRAARLEAYSSYSEFIRRTALIEALRILKGNGESLESEDKGNE